MRATWLALGLTLALGAGPALAETDTPVTLDRRESPEVGEELRVYGDGSFDQPTPHMTMTLWRKRVEVRVRAVSGLPLTEEEQGEVEALAVACEGGDAHDENLFVYFEADNTMVLSFDCVRIE